MANRETREAANEIAKRAGSIIDCPTCGEYAISAGDEDTSKLAYAMATSAWKKKRVVGFRGMKLEEVLAEIRSAIEDANRECPGCAAREVE